MSDSNPPIDPIEQDASETRADESVVAVNDRPLVEVENLEVSFDGQTVLKDIDCQIERGQTVAVIGESGCGKTV
ncbi:MAG: ATP-binding cassette domain-containing protein, partial [Rhodopirellula bahusiensis]